MTIRLQHPVQGGERGAAELSVTEDGSIVGTIRPDPKSDIYRFFPGTTQHSAFSLQLRDIAEQIAIVTSQSPRAEPPQLTE